MTTKDTVPMTRDQLKEIKIYSAMLSEAADKLDKLSVRRHPDLVDAGWLIRNAVQKGLKVLKTLELNF